VGQVGSNCWKWAKSKETVEAHVGRVREQHAKVLPGIEVMWLHEIPAKSGNGGCYLEIKDSLYRKKIF
jgi:hypothetical protein